jgi:uncharacterized membrane protein YfhO
VTLFDDIQIVKLGREDLFNMQEIPQLRKLLSNTVQYRDSPSVTNYKEINPTLWTAHINTSKPFIVGLAVPYDQNWEARIYNDGKKIDTIKSVPLYGTINGFEINNSGNLDVVIRYVPQEWYEAGLVISGISITIGLFYIFYNWILNLLERLKKILKDHPIGPRKLYKFDKV